MESNPSLLTLAQLNMQRAVTVTAELVRSSALKGVDILCVQEPYCGKSGEPAGFPMKDTVITGRRGPQDSKAAIVVRNSSIDVIKLGHLCDPHTVCVEVT